MMTYPVAEMQLLCCHISSSRNVAALLSYDLCCL
ncbi:hypothetical protein BVRB_6g145280 [Beta vulgaris subsp. vulgaris]|uniref:Uncharacterized protein n=1 Tax=Beta vulgaris subsp. vulgaris TaxID=3555 RepID=A0A0J8C2D6_BETVV|nr:hypothetical protein BVRB_6g145280 [Beta vulgaris subsp. vulgaris]